jgi:hypothetical protein
MIDRKLELEKLLENLKKSDTENNTDIDLILGYLEECISDPKSSGGSKKLQEFYIDQNPTNMTKTYTMKWIQTVKKMVINTRTKII